MAAHRYWRIQIRANGGTWVSIGELHMRTSIGGANVAVGGTPSASSVAGTYPVAKAFDGLTTDTGVGNAWASGVSLGSGGGTNAFAWLKYDFGAGNEKDIQEIVIFAPGTGGIAMSDLPTSWNFQYSDDDVTWVTQRSYSFESTTPAWTTSTSRVYDVRPLGPIDIHNYTVFSRARSHPREAPGQPTAPIYNPSTEEGKMLPINRYRFQAGLGHAGEYKIAGTTTVLGNPAPRRVRLYHHFSGRFVAEQVTKADGLFEFPNIEIGPWIVVGIDDTGTQNGVIFSHIEAVPM